MEELDISKEKLSDETNDDSLASPGESDNLAEDKLYEQDRNTEMRILFRIGTILANGNGK